MTRAQALARLRKLLGKSAAFKIRPDASDAAERAAAREKMPAVREQRDTWEKLRKERADFLLANDADYQRLKADAAKARTEYDALCSAANSYRITAGTASSMFFHVKAEGDTWPEVFAKLESKQ